MEYSIHSIQASFWRDAYVAALRAGHLDPAAAADEAFLAFDCRFIEPTIDGAALGGAPSMVQHVPQFYAIDDPVPQEKLDFLVGQDPSSIEVDPTAMDELYAVLTADELFVQTSEIKTITSSVVVSDPPVQNPSTEGLPVYGWKPDDEVLG